MNTNLTVSEKAIFELYLYDILSIESKRLEQKHLNLLSVCIMEMGKYDF